ncbi:MAG: hypothetical protein ACE5JA_00895 [bacterium]
MKKPAALLMLLGMAGGVMYSVYAQQWYWDVCVCIDCAQVCERSGYYWVWATKDGRTTDTVTVAWNHSDTIYLCEQL